MNFLIHHTTAGDVSTVRIAGELDLATAGTVTAALTASVGSNPVVVVDLAGVTFMDCRTLGVLVATAGLADRTGGRFVVAEPSLCVEVLIDTFDLRAVLCEPTTRGPEPSRIHPPVARPVPVGTVTSEVASGSAPERASVATTPDQALLRTA